MCCQQRRAARQQCNICNSSWKRAAELHACDAAPTTFCPHLDARMTPSSMNVPAPLVYSPCRSSQQMACISMMGHRFVYIHLVAVGDAGPPVSLQNAQTYFAILATQMRGAHHSRKHIARVHHVHAAARAQLVSA
jgi:hypothetical protein